MQQQYRNEDQQRYYHEEQLQREREERERMRERLASLKERKSSAMVSARLDVAEQRINATHTSTTSPSSSHSPRDSKDEVRPLPFVLLLPSALLVPFRDNFPGLASCPLLARSLFCNEIGIFSAGTTKTTSPPSCSAPRSAQARAPGRRGRHPRAPEARRAAQGFTSFMGGYPPFFLAIINIFFIILSI